MRRRGIINRSWNVQRAGLFVVVALVAGLGTYLLVTSHAASPYATINADKGTLGGTATILSDATASDGKSVQFKAGSGGGGTPITAWVACSQSFVPQSDAVAASRITLKPENRPNNATVNNYVPTTTELQNFHNSKDQFNNTPAQTNPYYQYVDGRPGISNPSTDDLIQWGAQKWGIPEDWLRAQYVIESYWQVETLGDRTTVSTAWYNLYPPQARVPNTSDVYQSMGLTQERWAPDGSYGNGTEPLRWESTAFNVDYQAATVRFYYDDPGNLRDTWGDSTYQRCQDWNSIGGWFNPFPWNNSGQQTYIGRVQQTLSDRTWAQPGF